MRRETVAAHAPSTYRAEASSARDGRKLRKTFTSLPEAKAWRADAQVALRRGMISAAAAPMLEVAVDAWLTGARAGSVRNRSGDEYKPSALRGYEQALRLRVLPELGKAQLKDIRRADLQGLIDWMLEDDHPASTIRNTLMPVSAIYRRALVRGDVPLNPTIGFELPAVRGRRDRVASTDEARALLAALPRERAAWARARLRILLDEATNIAPLPELPRMLSQAAGHGIRFAPIWQSLAQVTQSHGRSADTILANSTAKLIMGPVRDQATARSSSAMSEQTGHALTQTTHC